MNELAAPANAGFMSINDALVHVERCRAENRLIEAEAVCRRILEAQPDLSLKWRPTYVRIVRELTRSETNKVLKRELQREKFLGVEGQKIKPHKIAVMRCSNGTLFGICRVHSTRVFVADQNIIQKVARTVNILEVTHKPLRRNRGPLDESQKSS
jgi:hypothetical protein